MTRLVWLLVLALPLAAQSDVAFVNEGVVDAPVSDVWKVFSTSQGYKALGPALADVDLRVGGIIRSRYKDDGSLGDDHTIENVILAFEPPTMMAIRIHKPPKGFPFPEAWKKPWTVITLRAISEARTLVRVASVGYGTDPESLAMKRFFEAGNQDTITVLQKHFGGGK